MITSALPRYCADFLRDGTKSLLVDGRWIPGSGEPFETIDPATGVPLATLASAGADEVDTAVAAARRALQNEWASCTPAARARVLWRIAETIDAHADELAELETLDQGKAWATSRFAEIPSAAEQFRYYAGWATKITGTTVTPSITYAPPGRKVVAHTVREPVGVVAAIVPWNSPLLMAAMKLAPALAAGCTVVLKPAEDTSLTALRFGELLAQSGIPDGVVNILTGSGEVGRMLAEHSGVDKVTFTGSTEVGKKLVASAGARNLSRLTLELGGKSPAVVFGDTDLPLTIPGLARGIFANCGQVCVAGSRIYAERRVYEQVVDGLATAADTLRLGHGLDDDTDLGPLVSLRHRETVASYVDDGVRAGATVVTGGRMVGETGSFYEPTVVVDAAPDLRMMREEIFGPVVTVTPFDDPDEVITWANDTDYGLAASVWTSDLSRAHRVADAIRAGTVWINCHSYFSPELVKGGHKQSGWGYENGAAGLENYLETKTVCLSI
ncbi:aldehyde dehydrogenase family protein [Rhodococcus pyridinivorans]|uniref:aldehyde dehydrogenase family protein n=1 Tax=Rhodococcus pyridinivorans TaxID=103816 RepID=UPI002284D113|nr:aldehyde dehydrogenase family protein [Rhodococcus pyridinivorans]WAL47731.1 aldehyde dehydrogenase family protein [Rhodococcus pyridinivorans]